MRLIAALQASLAAAQKGESMITVTTAHSNRTGYLEERRAQAGVEWLREQAALSTRWAAELARVEGLEQRREVTDYERHRKTGDP